jgi:hypothetical protein
MSFINASITDKSSFSVCKEQSPGVLPTTPDWTYLEINSVSDMGETISTTERNPISNDRMRRKGSVTDLDSAVGFDTDLTYSLFDLFAQGFWFSTWDAQDTFTPTAVTTSGYAVPSGGDLAAGTLVYARGYANSTNNGLKICDTSTVATEVEVTDTLVADASPATGSRVDVVGVQGANGDIEMDADGNLTSTTLDFTTLDLRTGQWIYVGGGTTNTSFATSGDGYARVQAVATNKVTLEKKPAAFTTDAGTGKTIQLFIGSFIKNVAYDDPNFNTETYTFEVIYDTLTNKYHYPNGNYANEMGLSLNMTDKATVSYSFIGLDTPIPTSVRAAGNWYNTVDNTMMNTTSDIGRLEIIASDGSEIVPADECLLQSLSINISNNITPKKGVGCLGAVMVALGNFNVDISATMYLTSSQPIVSVRNNDTVGLSVALKNEDGGLFFDIPSMTIGDGSRAFPANHTIDVSLTGMAFKDSFHEFALGCTKFPYLPEGA